MIIQQGTENFWKLRWLDEFMIGHKGFICGGCFKNIFNNEKVKDLDIFFENKSDFDEAVNYFDRHTIGYNGNDKDEETYKFYYENKNVKAYKHIKTGIVLELCCKIFGTAEQIIKQFDFTIVKFVYYKVEVKDDKSETYIEYKILMDDKFFEHLHLKRLVIDDAIPYPMSTFERILKYAKYGYFPCKETKIKLISALKNLTEEQIEVSENLYNGMD